MVDPIRETPPRFATEAAHRLSVARIIVLIGVGRAEGGRGMGKYA